MKSLPISLITISSLGSTALSFAIDHQPYKLFPRVDASDYVYTDPSSYTGTCKPLANSSGTCRSGKASWEIDIPCMNSRCDDDFSSCTVAYAADGTQKAKCATNLVAYDWVWPYIDEDAKTKINAAGARRNTVDTCMKTAQKDLDGAASDSLQVSAAQEVFKCYNDQVVAPAGKSGKEAVNDARNTIKSVNACVKTADGQWKEAITDMDKKAASVALVACYDTVHW